MKPKQGHSNLDAIIACPHCGGKLRARDNTWDCSVCDRHVEVDQHGVICLALKNVYYREVVRSFFDPIMQGQSREDVRIRFIQRLGSLDDAKHDHLLHYVLNPARGTIALAAPVGSGSTSLDFGGGWGSLSRSVARAGGIAVCADMTYESLVVSAAISEPARVIHVHIDRKLPLPFPSDSFDNVFLNGVLEWLPEEFMPEMPPDAVQQAFLQEFARILRPNGSLVIGIENRNSFLYWAGTREDHTNLRFGAILPRPVANWYSKAVRGCPYRTYTYTRRGYQRLLTGGGFDAEGLMVPWRRYRNWKTLVPSRNLQTQNLIDYNRRPSIRGHIRDAFLAFAGRLGILLDIVPDFYILARLTPTSHPNLDGFSGSILQRIVDTTGGGNERLEVVHSSSAENLILLSQEHVFKVALSNNAENRLFRELEAGKLLQESRLQQLAPPPGELGRVGNLDFQVQRRIPVKAYQRPKEHDASEAIEAILDAVMPSARVDLLENTDFWSRINTQEFLPIVESLHAEKLHDWLLANAASQSVLVGQVHGDFCCQNLLRTSTGETVFVDWDRYEEYSPLFLDVCHMEVNFLCKLRNYEIVDAFKVIVTDRRTAIQDYGMARLNLPSGDISCLIAYFFDRVQKEGGAVSKPTLLERSWIRDQKRCVRYFTKLIEVS